MEVKSCGWEVDELRDNLHIELLEAYSASELVKNDEALRKVAEDKARAIEDKIIALGNRRLMGVRKYMDPNPTPLMLVRAKIQVYETLYCQDWSLHKPGLKQSPKMITKEHIKERWRCLLEMRIEAKVLRGTQKK